jgi:hypothetical protein
MLDKQNNSSCGSPQSSHKNNLLSSFWETLGIFDTMLPKKNISIYESMAEGKNVSTSSFKEYESPQMTPEHFKQKQSCFVTTAKPVLSPPLVWEPKNQLNLEPNRFLPPMSTRKKVAIDPSRFSLPTYPKKKVVVNPGGFSLPFSPKEAVAVVPRRFSLATSPKKRMDVEARRFSLTSPRKQLAGEPHHLSLPTSPKKEMDVTARRCSLTSSRKQVAVEPHDLSLPTSPKKQMDVAARRCSLTPPRKQVAVEPHHLSPPTSPKKQMDVRARRCSLTSPRKQVAVEPHHLSLPTSPKKQVNVEPCRFFPPTSPRKKVAANPSRLSLPTYPKKKVTANHCGLFLPLLPEAQVLVEPRRASNTKACWMEDGGFAKSKVFQTRLDNAATTIQKNARRFLQSHCLHNFKIIKKEADIHAIRSESATRIQTRARGMLQRVCLAKCCAARSIQAGVRGMWVRQNLKITFLEQRLAVIEDLHQRELADIKARKRKQKKHLLRERDSDEKKNKKGADQVRKTIKSLKKENKKIRSKNEELQESCEKLSTANQTIEKSIEDALSKCDHLKGFIDKMEDQTPYYGAFSEEFECRKLEYVTSIERHQEKIEFELTVSMIYRESLSQIKESMQLSKSCDFVTDLFLPQQDDIQE